MKIRLILLISLITSALHAEQSYYHEATGILLPHEITGLTMGSKNQYDEVGLGESIAYNSNQATATIYVYNYEKESLVDDPKHTLAANELSKAVRDILEAESIGIYENVEYAEKANLGGNVGIFTFLSTPVSYSQTKDFNTREPITPIFNNSYVGVGIAKNHYVKLRYSIRPGGNLDELKEQRDDFVEALVSLVSELDDRAQVRESLSTYLSAPFGPEAKNAIARLAAYAQDSYLVTLTIHPDVTPWFGIDNYPYGNELLGAYIAGQLEAQFTTMNFHSQEEAGMKQVLKVYQKLKEDHPDSTVPKLDAYLSEKTF